MRLLAWLVRFVLFVGLASALWLVLLVWMLAPLAVWHDVGS